MWRELIATLACGWPEVRYVGSVDTLAAAHDRCRREAPALLLLDLWLPDGDALTLARELRCRQASVKIIACTVRSDDVVLHSFDRWALDAMVWKEMSLLYSLHAALKAVIAGCRYFPPELEAKRRAIRTDHQAWFKILSDREQDLLPLLGQGMSDLQIAEARELSSETVHSHRKNIMSKLGLHRTVDLVSWARQTGFVRVMAEHGRRRG